MLICWHCWSGSGLGRGAEEWAEMEEASDGHPSPLPFIEKLGSVFRDCRRESKRMDLTLHACEILMR